MDSPGSPPTADRPSGASPGGAVPSADGREPRLDAVELLELGDAFFELDRDWRIVRVNRRQEELSRKPRAETVGRTFAEVWPELATPASRYWREFHRCMSERVPVQFEECYLPLGLWTGVTAYPLSTGGIAVFFRDVTAARQAARERSRLAAIVESTDDAIVSKDLDGVVVTWNAGAERLFGYTAEEIVGRPIGLIVPADRAGEEDRIVAELRAGRRVEPFETKRVRKDGAVVDVSVSVSPLRDASGEIVGASKIARDVTEHKRARQALRASEARFRSVFEQSAVGMGRVHFSDARWIDVNDAFCRMLGRSRDEMLRTPWPEMTHPEDLDLDLVPFRRMAAGELESYSIEKRFIHRDGHPVWAKLTLSLVRDAGGAPDYEIAIIEDVDDRKRAEEALRASEERWNTAIEHFTEGAIIATEAEQVIYWNPAARAMHGFTGDREGLGPLRETPDTFELWTPDGARLLELDEWPMRRIRRGEPVRRLELRLRRPDQGWERFVSYSGAMVQTAAGERLIFLSVTDLTHQRRAELALRAADRRKDEFLGMLSHELRNPLAPIRNALYVLDHAEPTGQQARRAREVANRQVVHLTRLVDDLLDVTRIARGKIELRRAALDLAALARRTAEDYRALMRDRGIDLAVGIPEAPLFVNGDETRLAQVLGNLLSNAAKFTPAGERVTLAIDGRGDRAVVRVRDTGVGLAPDLLETIFDPFIQAKQTLARSEGGLGLGLALVKGLTELHGGRVAARSRGPGHGTEFTVELPLAEPARAVASRSAPPAKARTRRVLVVDDNVDAADSLAELVRLFGHEVSVAYDGPGALASAAGNRPDVVLCDLGLPGMDGYQVARALRAELDGEVQLVAVSGYAQPEDVRRSADAGFDAHVAKPPDPAHLERLFA